MEDEKYHPMCDFNDSFVCFLLTVSSVLPLLVLPYFIEKRNPPSLLVLLGIYSFAMSTCYHCDECCCGHHIMDVTVANLFVIYFVIWTILNNTWRSYVIPYTVAILLFFAGKYFSDVDMKHYNYHWYQLFHLLWHLMAIWILLI